MELISSVGRRKTSVARLYMKSGKGVFKINELDLEKYFTSELLQLIIKQPIEAIDVKGKFDFKVNVYGGGLKGQAEAIRLAISKELNSKFILYSIDLFYVIYGLFISFL